MTGASGGSSVNGTSIRNLATLAIVLNLVFAAQARNGRCMVLTAQCMESFLPGLLSTLEELT